MVNKLLRALDHERIRLYLEYIMRSRARGGYPETPIQVSFIRPRSEGGNLLVTKVGKDEDVYSRLAQLLFRYTEGLGSIKEGPQMTSITSWQKLLREDFKDLRLPAELAPSGEDIRPQVDVLIEAYESVIREKTQERWVLSDRVLSRILHQLSPDTKVQQVFEFVYQYPGLYLSELARMMTVGFEGSYTTSYVAAAINALEARHLVRSYGGVIPGKRRFSFPNLAAIEDKSRFDGSPTCFVGRATRDVSEDLVDMKVYDHLPRRRLVQPMVTEMETEEGEEVLLLSRQQVPVGVESKACGRYAYQSFQKELNSLGFEARGRENDSAVFLFGLQPKSNGGWGPDLFFDKEGFTQVTTSFMKHVLESAGT